MGARFDGACRRIRGKDNPTPGQQNPYEGPQEFDQEAYIDAHEVAPAWAG
ncbi:hypothetical protein GCM10023170_020420 [Phytohabitans houttuyneae]|uniref:Uncharacterized protein n=1 Tax=Phytohabitans houttuyneae TaxID=1076126 RepID=A0A6V8JYD2_9ACTN|nr:hypothetical protein Phou_004440 [Phytohabitans houttuyneae]